MQILDHAATNIRTVGNSLADFYRISSRLSKIRFVRITQKEDQVDCIQWSFVYRKRRFVLQYSIYDGASLFSEEVKDEKLIDKLAGKLQDK